MSDKEFDKLFQDKFDSFEVEPSPGLWLEISTQVKDTSGKKSFPYLTVAAASLALVLLGVWLLPRREPMKLYSEQQANIGESVIEAHPTRSIDQNEVASASKHEASKAELVLPELSRVIQAEKEQEIAARNGGAGIRVNASSGRLGSERSREEENLEPSPEVQTATSTALASSDTEPSFTALAHFDDSELTEIRQKRKIKSVGDIVNFVVGKVDKRDNKIIEFKNEEEGNVVSGINLGLVQFKSKEK